MKILFVTSECAPFSKSGGLADVAGSLPPALMAFWDESTANSAQKAVKAAGDEIAVISPLYQCVRDKFGDKLETTTVKYVQLGWRSIYCGLAKLEHNGVTHWFVENEEFFARPRLYGYDDDRLRFAFFSKAVIDVLFDLDFVPGILHCNDWETALTVVYLKDEQTRREELRGVRTVYTIHNIAYQGQFGSSELTDTFGLPWGWYDGGLGFEYEGRRDVNLMKGAMLMADAVSTVSPTYARELHYPQFGQGLQGVADLVEHKLRGILNGLDIDLYDPEKNPNLPAHFSLGNMHGKLECKIAVQKRFGLEVEAEFPLLSSVARLVEQKGIELVKQVLPGLMDMGVQLVVFGQGDQQYIDYFNWAKENWPGQIGFSSDYNDAVASEIFAGSDFYLMPSRFEPCGLSQMMAMRFGTVPIVHETGGLKDSVRPYSDFDGVGDGFSFSSYEAKDLYLAILEAVKTFFCDRPAFIKIRDRCMTKDFSWKKSAEQYDRMYGEIYEESSGAPISFDEAFAQLKDAYIALDQDHRKKHPELVRKEYSRTVQINITGRGAGSLYVQFENGKLTMEPYEYAGAAAVISASLDDLLGMAKGSLSYDKLFLNGRIRIDGNVVKGSEMRQLLSTAEVKW